jgi:hypothetical protein
MLNYFLKGGRNTRNRETRFEEEITASPEIFWLGGISLSDKNPQPWRLGILRIWDANLYTSV